MRATSALLAATAMAAVLALGTPGTAQALTQVQALINIDNNDCSGLFGTSPNCNVEGPTGNQFSPQIAKYTPGSTTVERNTGLFPSFAGTEITFANGGTPGTIPSNASSNSWSYVQGPNDPGIRYWTAKAGPEFNLFWVVPDTAVASGGACVGTKWTDACLTLAQVVTSGTYATPDAKNLSHITFYDSTTVVPIPAALPLMLTALGGLGLIARRRAKGGEA